MISVMLLSLLLVDPGVNQSYTWGETLIVVRDDLSVSPGYARAHGIKGKEKTVYYTVVITPDFPLLRYATEEEIKRLQKRGFPKWE